MNNFGMRMTPVERLAGRFMRAPDHNGGTGGDSQGSANNTQGGNQQQNDGSGSQGNDYSGQADPLASFWQEPGASDSGSPSGGSAGQGTQASGNQPQGDDGAQIGQRFAEQLSNLAFQPVFNSDVANQIADGNLDGVNQGITAALRDSVRNSLIMSAQLMQAFGQNMEARMQAMIQEQLGNRDNNAMLMSEFPQAAADPRLRPVIEGIFTKALKNSNGDREKAKQMTRDMLEFVSTGIGKQLGLNDAPGSAGDTNSGALSLVEELMAR